MTKKAGGVVSAKLNPQGKQEGNPTEGLTYEEFGRNNGRKMVVVEELEDCDENFIDDHTLTVTMNRLRAKIEDEEHVYIKTVRGMGYIWEKP